MITTTELSSITPIFIIVFTIITVMIFITFKRNNFLSVMITSVGFSLSLILLLLNIKSHNNVIINDLIIIDGYSRFYTGLILFSSLVISMFSYSWFLNFSKNYEEFFLLILIATVGSMLLTNANHLATLCLGIELISLPLFGMIGYLFYDKYSFMSCIKYTLLSVITSSFLLFGIGLYYFSTGTLSFLDVNLSINNNPLFLIGLGLILVSISFKLSLIPFHLWTPDLYKTAPVPVVSFISTTSKISIFSILLRFLYSTQLIHNIHVQILLTVMAFFSILGANLIAINKCMVNQQININQILGYSSIINFGYLLISLISLTINHVLAIETINIYIFNYVLTNLCIFSIISFLSRPSYSNIGSPWEISYYGIFFDKPIITILLTVMILSLSGIPITLGFISKLYLLILSINTKLWLFTGLIVIGSLMSMFFYLKIINNLYYKVSAKEKKYNFYYKNKLNIIIVFMCTLLIILLGFYPKFIIDLTKGINLG